MPFVFEKIVFVWWILFIITMSHGFQLEYPDSDSSEEMRSIRYDIKGMGREMVHYINHINATWKAGYNKRFENMDMRVIRGMMGFRPLPDHLRPQLPVKISSRMLGDEDIPDQFDSRDNWPQCPSMKEVRDQSNCGSCWAFGAVEAMSDRACIASLNKDKPHISANDLLSCCSGCGFGCDGGDPRAAWEYWVSSGLVTGGTFTTHDGCQPYPFAPCDHHVNGTLKPCSHDLEPTPQCKKQCQSSYTVPYTQDKHFGKRAYTISSDVKEIQKEIMTNGPVEVAFSVYEDFLAYKTGVYKHHAGSPLGGHAVKMIGWGTDGGTPYWLVVNSWNTDWGDKGLFKILRGKDECGIESEVTAGLPKTNHVKRNRGLTENTY
jgi:cathepsin B